MSLRELNIKADMPTAKEAIRRLTAALHTSRQMGCTAVKIIHGYGSTGKGGAIRLETRRHLEKMFREHQIRAWIPGEDFSIFSSATREAFSRCDALRRDPDLERHNNGITVVIL